MALIAEDGTGKADAESFCTVAEATAYHAAFGNAAWAALASDAVREACLRKATSYMEGCYRNKYEGLRKSTAQALSWPRSFVPIKDAPSGYPNGVGFVAYYDNASVPAQVKNACASLALRSATSDLAPDLEREILSESVGGIDVTYRAGVPQYVRYREIEMMLSPFIDCGTTRLVRG